MNEWEVTARFKVKVRPGSKAWVKMLLTDAINEAARSIAEDMIQNDEGAYKVSAPGQLRMRLVQS